MKIRALAAVVAAVSLLSLAACDGDTPSLDKAQETLKKATEQAGDAVEKASGLLDNLDTSKVDELAKIAGEIEKDPSQATQLLEKAGSARRTLTPPWRKRGRPGDEEESRHHEGDGHRVADRDVTKKKVELFCPVAPVPVSCLSWRDRATHRANPVTVFRQQHLEELEDGRLVVDDQNVRHERPSRQVTPPTTAWRSETWCPSPGSTRRSAARRVHARWTGQSTDPGQFHLARGCRRARRGGGARLAAPSRRLSHTSKSVGAGTRAR